MHVASEAAWRGDQLTVEIHLRQLRACAIEAIKLRNDLAASSAEAGSTSATSPNPQSSGAPNGMQKIGCRGLSTRRPESRSRTKRRSPRWRSSTPLTLPTGAARSGMARAGPRPRCRSRRYLATEAPANRSLPFSSRWRSRRAQMGWADRPQRGGRPFVSAEDAIEELHRRLAAIIRTQRAVIGPDGLKSLDLLPLAGHDAILAAPKTNGGVLGETRLFEALEAEVDNLRPALLILDTLADLFGGDEIKRPHARQLIGMLRGLAIRYRLTILLLSHPSLSGMSSGADTSGSTAWSNSVRSRLYLESPKGADEDAGDDDRRILTTKKANYGRAGGSVALRWENGVFVPDRVSSAEQMYANVADESLFLEILAAFDRAGRPVSEKPSSTYAPHLFAGDPKAKGVSKKRLEAAMQRMFSSNRLHVETSGPPSKPRGRIVVGPAPEPAQ